LLYVGVEKVIQ